MQTSRRWAAACYGLALIPMWATSVILTLLQPVIVATYHAVYRGKPLPSAITNFVVSPVVPWVLVAIPSVATLAILFARRPTVESVVLVALADLAYAWTLLLAYLAIGVGCALAVQFLPMSS